MQNGGKDAKRGKGYKIEERMQNEEKDTKWRKGGGKDAK